MSLTQAEFTRFSAAETEWDFVEAPSQIMEHWVWEQRSCPDSPATTRPASPSPPSWWSSWPRSIHQRGDPASARSSSAPWTWRCTRRPMRPTWSRPRRTWRSPAPVSRGHLHARRLRPPDGRLRRRLLRLPVGGGHWRRHVGPIRPEGILSPEVGAAYRRAILEPNGSATPTSWSAPSWAATRPTRRSCACAGMN